MARVRDLWHSEVKDPKDPTKKIRKKTTRHPENGGSKNAKRWLAIWITPEGKEDTKAFRIKDAAIRHARKQEEDIERGEYISPELGNELFGSLALSWLKLRAIGGSSMDRYEQTHRKHVGPTFDHREIKAVKPTEVLAWLRALEKTHGSSTLVIAYLIVCGAFDLAVADGRIKENPARSPIVPRPLADPAHRQLWPVEQAWAVIDAHPAEYRQIPKIAAGLGLRENEALALAEEDFDFDLKRVHIRRQLALIGNRWYFKLPKGGKERVMPLPDGVAQAVKEQIQARSPRSYSLPWMREDGQIADNEHTCKLLFRWQGKDPRTHDQHIRMGSYNVVVWKPALAKAGVIPMPPEGKKGGTARRYQASPQDGMHALRHLYSALLQGAGVPLIAVMEFLGHSRKSGRRVPLAIGVYGHVTDEMFDSVRNAIDQRLFSEHT